jgi:hypothetical protein
MTSARTISVRLSEKSIWAGFSISPKRCIFTILYIIRNYEAIP